jgi:hypothetical protein
VHGLQENKFFEVRKGADDGWDVAWQIETQLKGNDRIESTEERRSFIRREKMARKVAELKGPKAWCSEISQKRYNFVPEFTVRVEGC